MKFVANERRGQGTANASLRKFATGKIFPRINPEKVVKRATLRRNYFFEGFGRENFFCLTQISNAALLAVLCPRLY
jgi:hypothetical protein